jgi:hypothetical protein
MNMKHNVTNLLKSMADTYEQRGKQYGNSYQMAGAVLRALGAPRLVTEEDFARYHVVVMCVIKLQRFMNSGMTHADSAHDLGVFATMLQEMVLNEESEQHHADHD